MFIHPMNTDLSSEISTKLINKYRPGAIPKWSTKYGLWILVLLVLSLKKYSKSIT
jgi:hypothetical protein